MPLAISGTITRVPYLSQTMNIRALRVGTLLLAVAILNVLDLIYTLFADRIGMLNEVNPIAASFLQAGLTPSLICFKILMVFCGLGLIWKFRGSKLAIPACWVLLVAYSSLGVVWYMWVRDVTDGMQDHLLHLAPP